MPYFNRRELLGGLVAGATATSIVDVRSASTEASESSNGPAQSSIPWKIFDTNLHLFHWPFRRLPLDSTQEIVEKLNASHIHQAWAGSFEGILHRDIASVNQRLSSECLALGQGRLLPFGTVNPTLPDWEDDLRRCHEEHHMLGVRLYPNYHDYSLDDSRFERLLSIARERRLIVQLCVSMEDLRTQHPKLRVADVALDPLPEAMKRSSHSKVMLLNYKPTAGVLNRLAKTPGLYFDMARVEGTDGIAKFVRGLPMGHVLFGTHAPFFIYDSGLIKIYESNLTDDETLAILQNNPEQLLALSAVGR